MLAGVTRAVGGGDFEIMHVPEVHCRMVTRIWTCGPAALWNVHSHPLLNSNFTGHARCDLTAGLSQGHAHVYSATALVLAPKNLKLRICEQCPKPSMAPARRRWPATWPLATGIHHRNRPGARPTSKVQSCQ